MENLLSFIEKAGPVGLIIIATSVIALWIVLDRVWTYRRLRIKDPKSLHRLCKRALEGHWGSAADAAKGETHPLFAALLEVLRRLRDARRPATRAELEKTIMHIGSREVRELERFLPSLFLISTLAPLLGMFGTVTGMIQAFQTIQDLGGKVNASVLAGGLWEAMLTTAMGLSVAIPAMIAHNFLQGKVHRAVADIQEEASSLLDSLEDAGSLGSTPVMRVTPHDKSPHSKQEKE
jgi:biopolymer transport protein ExbB